MSILDDINQANNKSTIRVNVWDYPSVVCEKCGSQLYIPAMIFKKISGLAIGAGAKEVIQPVPVYICAACHEIMSEYKKDMAKETNTNSTILT